MTLRTRLSNGGTPVLDKWGADSETARLRDVLIGPVEHFSWQPGNAVAQRNERNGQHFDAAVARAQYDEMLDAYRQAGVRCHFLPSDPELPYQIFARDSSVMTPWGALIMQMEKPYRQGELSDVIRFYLENEIPVFDTVSAGHAEGGDLMVLQPGVAVCGCSGERTSPEGAAQIARWFEAEGWEFHTYRFDRHFLHLDVQMGVLAPGLAVVCVEAVEPELVTWLKSKGIRIIEITYRETMTMGTNVVSLGDGRVMVPRESKGLIAACKAEGLEVFDPDVSMIAAGGGAVHCMCQPLRRDPLLTGAS